VFIIRKTCTCSFVVFFMHPFVQDIFDTQKHPDIDRTACSAYEGEEGRGEERRGEERIGEERGGEERRGEERRGVYRGFVGKPEGTKSFGRSRLKWEDNIKMDLQEVECGGMDRIDLAQNKDRW
jgi:hypothetical protein